MNSGGNKCDRCGEIILDIDAGPAGPAADGTGHTCGGTWRRPAAAVCTCSALRRDMGYPAMGLHQTRCPLYRGQS